MHIMKKLFDAFEKENIFYVHFKSNMNLDDSFAGRGDFDVLVDKEKITQVESIIISCNGRRHNPEYIGNYPGVDNWLIFDDESGVIYHLHLHYQLATGKALVKDYVIPWSKKIFATRVKDSVYGIYISNPNMELLLLSVRCILKSRFKDWVTSFVGVHKIHASLEKERQDLLNKVDVNTVKEYASELFTENPEKFVSIITGSKISNGGYRYMTKFVRRQMKNNRRMSGFAAQNAAVELRFSDLRNKFLSRKMGIKKITKKRSLSGGLIIAFVGVDGSGKSTMSDEMNKWLGRKIECSRFYMGTGDGQTTLYASILKKIRGKVGGGSSSSSGSGKSKRVYFRKSPFAYLKKLSMVTIIYDVEKNNNKKIRKMQRYRLNGGISLLDRYPQIESEGKNDGPKMKSYEDIIGPSAFLRSYQKKEAKQLAIVKEIKPDLVFRLNVTPESSMKRKGETVTEELREMIVDKIDRLNEITFQGATIIDIDTEQPYEEEVLEIKRILWRYV